MEAERLVNLTFSGRRKEIVLMAKKKANARRTGGSSSKRMSTNDVRISCSSDKVNRDAILKYAKRIMGGSDGDTK